MRTVREEAIAQLLLSRLREDRRTCGQTIDIIIEEGDVILVGICDGVAQKEAAMMIADGLCGIGKIIDKLHVRCRDIKQAI